MMKTGFFFLLLLVAAFLVFLFGDTVGVGWERGPRAVLAISIVTLAVILLSLWFVLRLGVRRSDAQALRRALTAALAVTGALWCLFAVTLIFADQLPLRSDGRQILSAADARATRFGLLALAAAWLLFFRAHLQLRNVGAKSHRETLEAFD
jgi:hypothetical protein